MSRVVDANQTSEMDKILKPVRAAGVREEGIRNNDRKTQDKFYVNPKNIPDGFVVQWKRTSVMGKPEEGDYFLDLEDAGWKPAPISQFPGMMPASWKGDTIERGGQILMIRPKELEDEARRREKYEANSQVHDKLREIGMTGAGELDRKVTAFKRTYENGAGIDVPD